MQEPLIFTTKGNVPESTLEYVQEWDDHIHCDVTLYVEDGQFKPKIIKSGYMVFIEKYYDLKNGELVKESRHVCTFQGLNLTEEQGKLQ